MFRNDSKPSSSDHDPYLIYTNIPDANCREYIVQSLRHPLWNFFLGRTGFHYHTKLSQYNKPIVHCSNQISLERLDPCAGEN